MLHVLFSSKGFLNYFFQDDVEVIEDEKSTDKDFIPTTDMSEAHVDCAKSEYISAAKSSPPLLEPEIGEMHSGKTAGDPGSKMKQTESNHFDEMRLNITLDNNKSQFTTEEGRESTPAADPDCKLIGNSSFHEIKSCQTSGKRITDIAAMLASKKAMKSVVEVGKNDQESSPQKQSPKSVLANEKTNAFNVVAMPMVSESEGKVSPQSGKSGHISPQTRNSQSKSEGSIVKLSPKLQSRNSPLDLSTKRS